MNKKKTGRKFSLKSDPRGALMRTWVSSLIMREKIKTTEAKAKEFRSFTEKFITKAKKADLSSRRYLLKFLPEITVKKLMDDIAMRYKSRNGGYTRIIRIGQRKSDSANMVFIELVDRPEKRKVISKKEDKK